jgi:hypothetical protein
MLTQYSRRDVIKSAAVAGLMGGLGDLSFLSRLNPVGAAETQLKSSTIRLQPEIEPLVRLLEETSRDRLLEEVASRIQGGLSYQNLLAALLLAGVKNVEPRPSVGHKFHAVLVVNSAHLASLASPPEHRWLPIFWALDYYKGAEARDVQERGDWTMSAIDEATVPAAHRCRQDFLLAMENWDESAADAAIAGLARTHGANEIYEMLFRLGARDFRSIGHKAIYVANSYRTLQCIGWQHAEPVLRSLAYALLMHEGDNPFQRDADADRPYRRNQTLAKQIRREWLEGKLDDAAAAKFIDMLRTETSDHACDYVVELLNGGVSPQSIWDGIHICAGEFLMRQPEIVALHAVTTTNALHYAFTTSGDDETRRLLMLQNAAFLPMFRTAIEEQGGVKDLTVEDLATEDGDGSSTEAAEIFALLGKEPISSARKALALLNKADSPEATAEQLMDAARLLVFLKGNDAHDYKFSSAVLEDYYHVSPSWRNRYFALNLFKMRSASDGDNHLVERTRAALGA